MLLSSLLEMLSVGAILPFIGAIINPEQLFELSYMQPIITKLGLTLPNQLILPTTVVFISATLFAAIIRITLLYMQNFITQKVGSDLSINIYKRNLYQDYLVHTSRNTSEVISSIISKTMMVSEEIIKPIMTLIGAIFIIVGLLLILIIIDINVALILFLTIGGMYLLITKLTIKQLEKNSTTIADGNTQMIKNLQEGLLGFREVLLNQSQNFYAKVYSDTEWPVRRSYASSQFLSGFPKFIIEAAGMTLIAILAYVMTYQNNHSVGAIPILAAFAIGAQRMLPALQQIFSSYASIKSANDSFKDVVVFLEQPLPDYIDYDPVDEISFSHSIELRNVSFKYPGQPYFAIENVNLVINKGDNIGLIGETGSGKSTLVDIIMGLLPPSAGEIIVDGVVISKENRHLWWEKISNVPQKINLFDTTIEENIAFGVRVDLINHDDVILAANAANISKVVDGWEKKYLTMVGEHGQRISGGQRQRIGIARALYRKSAVLVLDEATSALDNQTEERVISSITSSRRMITIIMIAHRLTTLKQCNKIIEITANKGIRVVKYNDIQK